MRRTARIAALVNIAREPMNAITFDGVPDESLILGSARDPASGNSMAEEAIGLRAVPSGALSGRGEAAALTPA